MTIEVKVPMLPESITDATVSIWHKKAGDTITRDENLVDLETDKVMLEVPAPTDGILKEIIKKQGEVVQANQVIAIIDSVNKSDAKKSSPPDKNINASKKEETPVPSQTSPKNMAIPANLSPSARRAIAEHGGEIIKKSENPVSPEVNEQSPRTQEQEKVSSQATEYPDSGERLEKRVPMTRMRARIAERLLSVSQNTAMLTTFNEVNLQAVMHLRAEYKDKFEKIHQTRLGFMSFFVKACVHALKRFPAVNASIDGNDIVYHGYFDIGVAVSTDRGLVVPVLRDADTMSMAEIEMKITEYATRARNGKLTLEEMQGGTFSITNGGVFGSLLATPIINAPQSAILGMHKIEERPVVEKGQIVIRPMMYVALSYDHRIIDGKESVSFLVNIKELLEDPARLLLEV